MLDFLLVLGQIPGTGLQLTFTDILLLTSLLIIAFTWRMRLFTYGYRQAHELSVLKHKALRQLGINKVSSGRSIRRKVVVPPERIYRRPFVSGRQSVPRYVRNTLPTRLFGRREAASEL